MRLPKVNCLEVFKVLHFLKYSNSFYLFLLNTFIVYTKKKKKKNGKKEKKVNKVVPENVN